MSIPEKIAARIEEKPIPSLVAFKLLHLLDDEDHSIKQVVQLIENDPSLTTEVLKVANSATYFRGKEVTTMGRAVLLMGEMMVVGIAICASSSIVFNQPLEGYHCKEGQMWQHAVKSAIASRELVAFLKKKIPAGLAFTAGLLHDIGKSVLSEFLLEKRDALLALWNGEQVEDFLLAERETVGTDHAQVGYVLSGHWGLPKALRIAIRDHHNPSDTDTEFRELVYTVHLGDHIAMMAGAETGSDSFGYRVDAEYADYFDITKDQFALLFLTVQEEFERIKATIMSEGKG
ncbi:MAG: HDOD domain-containing protein [bacterium]